MASPEDKKDIERTIEDLKRRAKELGASEMETGGLDECPAEIEQSFWQHIVDYEEAPWTTHFQQLEQAGVSLPPPDSLSDQQLTEKLWELIHKLALLRVFIEQTDHLSDRELYAHLWTESLREETKLLTLGADSACHIPILGGCSEEDNYLYLKYYADDDWRQQWHKDFPDDPIPAREVLPYERDRWLPKADYGPPGDEKSN